jgi:DegV family protein with EDD domain
MGETRMANIRIVTDSTADLPASLVAELGITVVPLQVNFADRSFRDGVDLTPSAFYSMLRASPTMPTTSQPSVGAFVEAYEVLAREADGILSIHLSSALSGTYNSAILARETFARACPIEVIDSRQASLGIGVIAVACARLARQGASLSELANHARRLSQSTHTLFLVETLEYLQRGGRIGRAAAFLGTLLSVRPLLLIEEGEVRPFEKVRTRGKGIDRLVQFVESFDNVDSLAILQATTPEDVEPMIRRIEAFVPRERIVVGQVGAVIGTHTGPGVLGIVVSQAVTG